MKYPNLRLSALVIGGEGTGVKKFYITPGPSCSKVQSITVIQSKVSRSFYLANLTWFKSLISGYSRVKKSLIQN